MKTKVIIMITIASCIAAVTYLLISGSEKTDSPCEIIDYQMASGALHHSYFKVYRDVKGQFPDNLDSFYKFLNSSESGYRSDQVSVFDQMIIDPYTKKEYVYFAFKVSGDVIDYVLYSLGPDKKDDNLTSLEAFNSGEKEFAEFRTFSMDCVNQPFIRSAIKADLIVRVPGRMYLDGLLKTIFIDP